MLTPKPLFIERMQKLIPDKLDFEKFMEFSQKRTPTSIRCNTLKISPDKLKQKLEDKGWKIKQLFSDYPEVMIIENSLNPGELGKSIEHILGYYYVQEISSMMPIIALNPKENEIILDLAAAPGSKTTQASSFMKNTGTIIANDKTLDRTNILCANLERCGCSNVIVIRHDGIQLCRKLAKIGMKFDKILLDLPCSGEGNTRSNPKTYLMWNIRMIKSLSKLQKRLVFYAIPLLKEDGELIYSTCTHSPEENEGVVDFLLKNFDLEIQEIKLPLKTRSGITSWEKENFNSEIKKSCRIYPQDSNTEGFFLCKMRRK